MTLVVRLAQLPVRQGRFEENLTRIAAATAAAADDGADLVVLPQYAVTGYPSGEVLSALVGRGDELTHRLATLAAEHAIAIACSLPVGSDAASYADITYIHGADGHRLGAYQRISKFWREDGCVSGDRLCLVEIRDTTVGFLAGDDIYFPEIVGGLAAGRASAVICLTYNATHRLGNAFSTKDLLPCLATAHAAIHGVDFMLCAATGTIDLDDGQSIIAGANLVPSTCAFSISQGGFIGCAPGEPGITLRVEPANLAFFRHMCRREKGIRFEKEV